MSATLTVWKTKRTTSSVARLIGAGDRPGAIAAGRDAAWLAAALGVVTALVVQPLSPGLVGLFGAEREVAEQADIYLRWSLPGLPAMLVMLALTGVLRGIDRTTVTLWIAAVGAVANAALNVLFVHGFHWGIRGSAIGTVLAQIGMGLAASLVVARAARRDDVGLRPRWEGVHVAGRSGVPLLIRTAALRLVLLVTTGVAAGLGAPALAAHQVAFNVWNLLALGLDALAIAGQALTGQTLGAGDVAGTRAATRRMIRWGVGAGVLLGVVLLLCGSLLGPLFSDDEQVRKGLAAALVVAAIAQPLAGYVFVLDGVLIGAGDGRFLAAASVLQTALFVPAALAVGAYGPTGTTGLVWLWTVFAGGWMISRAVLLGLRERSDAWLVTGASR